MQGAGANFALGLNYAELSGRFVDSVEHPLGNPVAQPPKELLAGVALELAGRGSNGLAERPSLRERVQELVGGAAELEAPDLVVLAPDGYPGALATDLGVVLAAFLDGLEVRVDIVAEGEDAEGLDRREARIRRAMTWRRASSESGIGRRSCVFLPATPVQQRWSETQNALVRAASFFSFVRCAKFRGSTLPIDIETPCMTIGYRSATCASTQSGRPPVSM